MDGFKIYGNEASLSKLSSMIKKDRIMPSILICGEKGLGKTCMAENIAAAINCERHEGVPCGVCRSCQMTLHKNHPDVIYVKATSAQGNYRVKEDIRPMIADSYIAPNEQGRKIYIIDNGEKLNEVCQNALLKVFEEPPGESVFILTAENKQTILPTVLSRVFAFELKRVSEDDAYSALTDMGISPDDAKKAQEAFPGNIGMQIEYLNGGKVFDSVVLARNIISALNAGSEYELLKTLTELSNRDTAMSVAELVCEILSRAAETADGAKALLSCDNAGADELASKADPVKIARLYDSFTSFGQRVRVFANLTVSTAALCAEISEMFF